MRREGMPQGVRTDRLGNARGAGGFPDRLLDGRLVQVVATLEARARVAGAIMGREGPLPGPIELGGRVLARERLRQVNRAETLGEIPPVERPNGFEVQSKGIAHGKRKHRPPILLTLSVPTSPSRVALTRDRFGLPQREPPRLRLLARLLALRERPGI